MDILKSVYYDVTNPGCFSGVENLLREAKKLDNKITKKNVVEFLEKQPTYGLHKTYRRRFRRNKTKSAGIDVSWQADLADMTKLKHYNSNFQYILVCTDVFSRFGFAIPIKNKTPDNVVTAFKTIMKTDRMPWRLTTDQGSEFKGKFQEFLRKNDIQHNYSKSEVKCAVAERFIRTLKSRIWKYFTAYNTKRYIDILPKILESINRSPNRTIGLAPSTITTKNEQEIWDMMNERKPKTPRFKVGDKVRVLVSKGFMSKGYTHNFTTEIYQISKVLKRRTPCYKIRDIDRVFYEQQLVKVVDEKRVEKIKKLLKSETRNGQLYHLVKFVNRKKPTWIPNSKLVSI